MEEQRRTLQPYSPRKDASKTASGEGDGVSPLQQPPLPGASLPKGGGAIRGMGEKFEANPVTGTASMSVPLMTSPGRGGVQPTLALSYDSAYGNSPFGFGWSLDIDSITRKTSKGLPRYRDDQESDVFLLSGVEDLVPVLRADGSRYEDKTAVPGYVIHRYGPRIEGSFQRIERWSNLSDATDVHWRVYNQEDLLSIYGRSDGSRIFNPEAPEQIFSWLISDRRDWKGNSILFTYKSDNGQGVDLTQQHEQSRGGLDDSRRKVNRYVKSIKYGNQTPFLDSQGQRLVFPSQALLDNAGWLFELVFDYGEHNIATPTPVEEANWPHRADAFSSYKSGFEVRTTRLCQRVLMFHHFADEEGLGINTLVSSTDLIYRAPQPGGENRVYTFLDAIEHSGYRRSSEENSGYVKRSMPRLEFKYSEPVIDDTLRPVDPATLQNAPVGLASSDVQWIDLYGEGISGMLTRTDQAWYYKRNISPINEKLQASGSLTPEPLFDNLEAIQIMPNLPSGKNFTFADLTGDGCLSILTENGSMGYYKEDGLESWLPLQPFEHPIKSYLGDPDVQLIDLTGDGLTDAFMTGEAIWYPSLGTAGFGAPEGFVVQSGNDNLPMQVFRNDILGTVHLADFTGDGLADIAQICNGEIYILPNLGYGKFGGKISMDNAPVFDSPEFFDPKRIVLVDIDGSGTTDIIYLHAEGARVYFNESGNSWSSGQLLSSTQNFSSLLNIKATDLHGNGTTCLVISSPLPADPFPMQYIDLMGSTKPHLLIQIDNNLGVSTQVKYSTSTKFYLQDKRNGMPWISKLAFPVHVVESLTTYDYISRNKFTTRYAYHHGHYDGEEREFRGFGMVEKWDTEELSAVVAQGLNGADSTPSFMLPPTHTKSWFHLGISIDAGMVSLVYEKEYFKDPAAWALPDTVLPEITAAEEHDAFRTLKGRVLRQEIFIDDAPPGSSPEVAAKSLLPVSVAETNFTLSRVEPKSTNRSAIFFATPRETISYHYERNLKDPRINHQMVLECNSYGQTLREVAVAYGRSIIDGTLPTQWDKDVQAKTYLTYTENQVTNDINDVAKYPNSYRLPVNSQRRLFELTGMVPEAIGQPFTYDQFSRSKFELLERATEIGYEVPPDLTTPQKRLLNISRTLFRRDDLTGLLPLGQMGASCIPGQSYSLSFTTSMINQTYQKNGVPLLSDPASLLTSVAGYGGGYLASTDLKSSGLFPSADQYDGYWITSGLSFYSLSSNASTELAEARAHFYSARRYQNPFGAETSVTYDDYDILILETQDPAGNIATVGERDSTGKRLSNGNDYRVLHPRLITNANGNRSAVAYDALGVVVGTAVMGKLEDNLKFGDTLSGFEPDLPAQVVLDHLANPTVNAKGVLQGATSRVIYDLFAYVRTQNTNNMQPAAAYSISRSTHEADLEANEVPEMQHAYAYSDGFGRIIQSKVQVKPGPVSKRGPDGRILMGDDGQPILTDESVDPRWISSGWVINNNKGIPVAKFEPFFTDLHTFEFDTRSGVSHIVFYDPLGRIVADLHPNNSYAKNLFSPWVSEKWDNNDTVELDPVTDPDVAQYTSSYFTQNPGFQTWLQQRVNKPAADLDKQAAEKTRAHARTPEAAYLDPLGRVYLKVGCDKVVCPDHELDGTEWKQYTRIELDIEGHKLAVRDANNDSNDLRGRIIETFNYDMLGREMVRQSMDTGTRIWLLNALGNQMNQWDDRGHQAKTVYDKACRHLYSSVIGDVDAAGGPSSEVIFNYTIFGEHHPQATELNLRGEIYLNADQAGITAKKRRDFKGNLLETSKRFNIEYRNSVDWSGLTSVIPVDMDLQAPYGGTELQAALNSTLQTEEFQDTVDYDALNRMSKISSPNSDGKPSTTRFMYNITSLVKIDANIRAELSPTTGDPVWTTFISDLDYDPRGLRSYIRYGNGVTTTYKYSKIGELTRLLSTRITGLGNTEALQDLNYTYDASQYHTNISDNALQTIYYNNQVVQPTNDYTYDALYQLIRATGREHLGQPGGSPIPYSSNDSVRSGPQPGDENAMGRYTEDYVYDHTGNMKKMKHSVSDPTALGHTWTRSFAYNEPSQLEPAKFGNRLTSAAVGATAENFSYDAHGNMVRMPHLGGPANVPNVTWNFLDMTKKLDLGGGGTAYYIYDKSGMRVRKVIERSPGLVQERLYLGTTLEIFRRHQSGQVKLERESLHILDDQNRAVLVETRTIDVDSNDKAPEQVQRYQLSSHLKSATVEIDKDAKILTYEEYSPYGSTTYVGTLSTLELPKRYRFTGKERDDESGLSYHGARYYAPWLARWTSGDPGGLVDGVNLYAYARLNPIRNIDPGGKASERPKLVIPDVKLTYPTMAAPKPMKPNLGLTQQLQLKPPEPAKKAEADPKFQLTMPGSKPTGIQLKPMFVYELKDISAKPNADAGPQRDLNYHIGWTVGKGSGTDPGDSRTIDITPSQSSQPSQAAKAEPRKEQPNPLHPEGSLYENKSSKGVTGVSLAANTDPGAEVKVTVRDSLDLTAKASYPKQQGTFNLTLTLRLGEG